MAMLVVEEVELLVALVEVSSVGIFRSLPHHQCSFVQRAQTSFSSIGLYSFDDQMQLTE